MNYLSCLQLCCVQWSSSLYAANAIYEPHSFTCFYMESLQIRQVFTKPDSLNFAKYKLFTAHSSAQCLETFKDQPTCMSPSPVSEFLMVPVASIDSIWFVMSCVRLQALDTMAVTQQHRLSQHTRCVQIVFRISPSTQEESDIRSLTDSEQYLTHSYKHLLRLLRARSKRSGSRLRAFGSLSGNYFIYMWQNRALWRLLNVLFLTSLELCIFAQQDTMNMWIFKMKMVLCFNRFSVI